MKDEFIKLLKESTIVQGLVTLVFSVTVSYMFIMGMQVPPELVNFVALVLGFYFGAKSTFASVRGK
jgi:hypothetical protein